MRVTGQVHLRQLTDVLAVLEVTASGKFMLKLPSLGELDRSMAPGYQPPTTAGHH